MSRKPRIQMSARIIFLSCSLTRYMNSLTPVIRWVLYFESWYYSVTMETGCDFNLSSLIWNYSLYFLRFMEIITIITSRAYVSYHNKPRVYLLASFTTSEDRLFLRPIPASSVAASFRAVDKGRHFVFLRSWGERFPIFSDLDSD